MMYGLTGFAYSRWQEIAGVPLAPTDGLGFRLEMGTDGATTYVICPHPASRGITGDFFVQIGIALRPGIQSGGH
jgi:hypothetical protein